jgi:hypothetical protein
MLKMSAFFKKFGLVTLVIAFGLAALPTAGAAASAKEGPAVLQPDDLRLERVWQREQAIYQRQGTRLVNASHFIARVQTLIDKASQKGWDTASVQAALDALSSVIPAVQAAHAPGAAILANHAGFSATGQVTDRTAAVATDRSLAQVLKDTRTAMDGTGRALLVALRALRDAQPRPTPLPAS